MHRGGVETPLRKQTATVADGTHPTGMHSCDIREDVFVSAE